MSDQGKTEAKAPVTEAVVDDTKVAVAAEETKAEVSEEKEAEKTETDAPVEGAEKIEDTEEKRSKQSLRRERQRAKEAALIERVADLEAKLAVADRNKPATDALGPKPDRAKYEDEAEYGADLAAWKVEERIIARQNKAHETTTTTARGDTAAAKMELFKERAMALTERYPDIQDKVFKDPTLPMSPVMADTLMESEKGPEVAYYLSSHREEAQRIKEMSPLVAAAALGRLEAKLSLPQPRTETKAPPPPSTLNGTVKGPGKNPEEMSQAEYVAWRNKGGGETRKG